MATLERRQICTLACQLLMISAEFNLTLAANTLGRVTKTRLMVGLMIGVWSVKHWKVFGIWQISNYKQFNNYNAMNVFINFYIRTNEARCHIFDICFEFKSVNLDKQSNMQNCELIQKTQFIIPILIELICPLLCKAKASKRRNPLGKYHRIILRRNLSFVRYCQRKVKSTWMH